MVDRRASGFEPVAALERGLAVLAAFTGEQSSLTLSDVAREMGIDRSSARRMLHTLAEYGFVRTDDQRFRLHPSALQLGRAYLEGLALPELAVPHLRTLSDQIHETALLGVLDGDELVVVSRVPTRRLMSAVPTVGNRFPAHATAGGRVLLARQAQDWLDGYLASAERSAPTERTVVESHRLRRQLELAHEAGYAVVDEELEVGLRSIAAPVLDRSGEIAAAVVVATHASRYDVDGLTTHVLPLLRAAATAIQRSDEARAG